VTIFGVKPYILKSKVFHFLLLVFISTHGISQELLPFVENYSKYNYQGDNQIWSVAQGNDNAMYFANNHYFLRYDGVKWEKYTLPDKTIIRSVFIDGEKIYTGSYKEFGYWYRSNGRMKYVSVSKNRNLFSDDGNEEIWKIFEFERKIYFQSFNELYTLRDDHIQTIKLPFQISYCFPVNGTLLYASIRDGVFKKEGGQFKKINGWDIVQGMVIHSIESYKGQTFIFTQKNGVFVSDLNGIRPWENPINTTLKTAIINVAHFTGSDKLIIGTASKGVYSINLLDDSSVNINRSNVLINNSVLSIGLDRENDLWLGLDNGVAHIEIDSPVSIFSDNSGTLGSVYSVATTSNGYLLASNHGIFRYENRALSMLPNSQGQAWNITKVNNQYLIGHNEGTFLYSENTLKKINSINGGWNLNKSNISDSFLQATYSGVVVYPDNADFSKSVQIKDFYKPIKYVAQDRVNEIWAADNYKGLYRVTYDENFKATKIENVTQRNNLPNDFGVKIFELHNAILFLIDESWYTYNSITGKLERNALFNSNFKGISDIVTVDQDHFLITQSGLLYLIQAQGDHFIWSLIQEKYYRGKIINDNLKIFRVKNQYLLNLDDGFISLNLDTQKTPIPKVKVEALSAGLPVPSGHRIKFNTALEVHVISGFYGRMKPNLFYAFDDNRKVMPIKDGSLIFNNLDSGDHRISFFYNNGQRFHRLATYEFRVARPWYFSFWMVLLYVVAAIFIWYLYYKWNKIKYNQRLALREEELKHQKKILELKLKAENELNIQEYEKHILELEVQAKSSEVAGKSLSIAKQSEMIENISEILDNETDIDKLKSEIRKAIRINAVNKHEWVVFENNLNQIHNEFITNLARKFPSLTSKDIKLCVYLKMNLSSKEIAPLMNITFRGVELHRYRLRKKMGLAQDDNLHKYMLSI